MEIYDSDKLSLKDNLKKIKELTEQLDWKDVITSFNTEVVSLFFENSPIVSWIKDIEGKYIFANKSFLQRFNIKEDIVGKMDKDYFPEEVSKTIRENDLMVLKRNEKIELRENVPTPNGKMHRWFVIKIPIIMQTKSYVGGFAVDITNDGEVNG